MRMTTHEASDITISVANTARLTMSPWVQTWDRPNSLFIESYSRTKLMGTLNHMASGTPPRVPGT